MLDYIFDMYNEKIKQTGFMKHYLILFAIVEGLETKQSFEFGTGISTRVIIEALKRTGGHHISCDIRDIDDTGLSQEFLADNINTWTYIQKNSIDIDFTNFDAFDFVLHDGSHIPQTVEKDIYNILPNIKNNGIFMLHDTIFEPKLNEIIKDIAMYTGNELINLPYGCGLSIMKIHNPFIPERIKVTWKKKK